MKIIFNSKNNIKTRDNFNRIYKTNILNITPCELLIPEWEEINTKKREISKFLANNFNHTTIELEENDKINDIKKFIKKEKIPGITIIKTKKKRSIDYIVGITICNDVIKSNIFEEVFMFEHEELNNRGKYLGKYMRAIVCNGKKINILKERPNLEPIEHLGKLYPVDKIKIKKRLMKEYTYLYFPYNSLIEARKHAKNKGYMGLIISGLDNDFDVIIKGKYGFEDSRNLIRFSISSYFKEIKKDNNAAQKKIEEKIKQLNNIDLSNKEVLISRDTNAIIKKTNDKYIDFKTKCESDSNSKTEKTILSIKEKEFPKLHSIIYKKVAKPIQTQKSIQVYMRNRIIVGEVLENAKYKCEFQSSHETFTSGLTGNMYMEVHHLIPMQYQSNFTWNLDSPDNMVSLCPTCHRMIHHGTRSDIRKIVTKLYNNRKNVIQINLDELLELYYK